MWLCIASIASLQWTNLGYSAYSTSVYEEVDSEACRCNASDLSIAEADRLITQVFTSLDIERYELAAEAYISILERIKTSLEEEEAVIVSRHMRALALIMEEAELSSFGIDVKKKGADFLDGLNPEISKQLIRWWRLQDVIPASTLNDRLIEHLSRVVTAWSEFSLPLDLDPRGFDDRGAIHIRLGEPAIKTKIRLFSTELQQSGVGLRVPPNEFWVYHHVAYDAHYIFTRSSKKTGFKISMPMDLVPKRLQIGRRNTNTLLLWMEEVFGQLAVHHNVYGSLYDEVANYVTLPGRNDGPADVFARSITHNAMVEEQQLVWQRSQNVPAMYTNRFGTATRLPIPFRWARYLEEDGRTRLEVYWSVEPDEMKLKRRFVRQMYKEGHEPSENYLVSVYSSLRNIDLTESQGVDRHYLTDSKATSTLPTRSLSLVSDTTLFNLVLHWEQRWTLPGDKGEDSLLPGVLVKYNSQVVDSIEALHAQGTTLEMSDLKALRFEEGTLLEDAMPYPYNSLSDTTQIALYFEVYNLTFGSDDQTAYTITYEVKSQKERRGQGTKASTSHTSSSRTAQEYMIPDLSSEDVSEGIEIILTIRDDLTGNEQQRSIQFLPD